MPTDRRRFLAGSAAGALLGCVPRPRPLPPGELLGPSHALGHLLRDGHRFPPPTRTIDVPVLIAGAGIGGLSCAWWLQRSGHQDFLLLDLEGQPGGNARWGSNAVTSYPWGAHYLPLPGPQARYVRLLLSDLGILRGDPETLRPEYDERHLCHSPQERLYIHGNWQEGVVPTFGLPPGALEQYRRFDAEMHRFASLHGADGRPAFALPLALSSDDPSLLALDRISMRDWLQRNGYDAPSLHWYIDYGCRDDYGTSYAETSAWAGIHYFASRDGEAANASHDTVLTWPEGNGWLVQRLVERFAARLRLGQMVYRIGADGREVDVYDAERRETLRYRIDRLVWAGPVGLLPRLWPQLPAVWAAAARRIDYAPWLVANLTLSQLPQDLGHAPLSWDNVLYQGQGLGYVVATHQSLQMRPMATVLTYYRALTEVSPAAGRQWLWQRSQPEWAQAILADLARAHPEIGEICTRLDVWRWGHAMARPTPGFLAPERRALRQPTSHVALAHADVGGISLFEEAQYWGVEAARWILDGGRPRNGPN
ncbi:FAD-dependent oxidoreductase [Chitinimonas lacunae]|uniref:FAD-dependent oxidoreductase n=1 Tax=Chitinimonas lacunae TaxID=1963018 RepID=A0ABV8MQG1_9NEIS